jgi:hypothetical protein
VVVPALRAEVEGLEAAEGEARKERRGWRDREPEPPWEFRKKERERQKPW